MNKRVEAIMQQLAPYSQQYSIGEAALLGIAEQLAKLSEEEIRLINLGAHSKTLKVSHVGTAGVKGIEKIIALTRQIDDQIAQTNFSNPLVALVETLNSLNEQITASKARSQIKS